ncbi:MAG: TerB family tellurite resistance protein [Deltaproteobacteria bacterium]|nr:MAG: TerB family tellurite resistance protein [Deltaproteobacteria bacterium]
MGWFGKIVGGTLGFAIGGPLGAIAGAALGHTFDVSRVQYYEDETPRLSYQEQAQMTFFVGAFSMLAKLSRADGRISPEEIRAVSDFMKHDLNLSPETEMFATQVFNNAIDSPNSFQDFATQFYYQFQHQPQLLDLMMDILLRVSVADGTLSESEERLINSAAKIFKFSEKRYKEVKSRYAPDFEKYYAILDTDSSASDEEIKKKYRKLAKEYHPDTIASKGLPEEFTNFAHEKFREIQEAYEFVKQKRGMN